MSKITVHIINHTHWDREWFLTSVYTSHWIPGLVNKLEQLVAGNPNFKFLFDGQTLVIEDLLEVAPEYEARVRQLVQNGNLIIGPYYCQPDWQLSGGELLIRNLQYGREDMQRYGGTNPVGWLVDTFGHMAQSPQLHRMFGLEAVYVWRGVPQLAPYFRWQGSDGQSLFTINLFGGYRNLYGISHAPEVAITRLVAEVDKLQSYYPTPDIPLFDGYDLEQDPEDPMQFYRQHLDDLPDQIALQESSPSLFAKMMDDRLAELPTIAGELNSGKYGATFPGTFSARTYLKIMQHDCEQWLFKRAEPLAALARLTGKAYEAGQYERWARILLQNSVHDCLCGVSIDQVHEKMEVLYRQVYQAATADVRQSLACILADFAPGKYAVSTNPFTYDGWQLLDDALYRVQTDGVGVWPLGEAIMYETPNHRVESFTWKNEHYTATVEPTGAVQIGRTSLGYFVVSRERGDTYSDEAGLHSEVCGCTTRLIIEQKSDVHAVVRYGFDLLWDGVEVTGKVELTFDQTPLIRWQIDLDSRGTDFRLDMVFETGQPGELYAGMQFDRFKRPLADTDLLPRQLEPDLAKVLLGQRELEAVRTFPFHDFVAIADKRSTSAVFARGLHAYQADAEGTIVVTLRRAVEWLTAADLKDRVGDAGPFFYVPDARCERSVRHELAVVIDEALDALALQRINAGFQNPPLIAATQGSGRQNKWQLLQESLPLTSLHLRNDQLLARFYNPTGATLPLSRAFARLDGQEQPAVTEIAPKQIATVVLDQPLPPVAGTPPAAGVAVMNAPAWRVGNNHGRPDLAIIAQLQDRIDGLERRLQAIDAELKQATGRDRYLLQHKYYVAKRESLEYQLSKRLNELKLAESGQPGEEYLFTPDEEVKRIGVQLNRLRIKRRIYDYVIEAI